MLLNPYRFGSTWVPSTTLTAGLLAWYDLEEASGTRADAMGAYPLTTTSGVGHVLARNGYGSAATASTYLASSTSPSLATGDFTIAGAFRTTQANAGLVSRQNASGASANRQYLVTLEGGVCYLAVSTDGAGNAAAVGAGASLNDGTLRDFIAWRDTASNVIGLQIDGGTPVTAALSGSTALYSAVDPGLFLHAIGATTYANGSDLDSVGIWGRMLSATERGVLRNDGAWRSYAQL